MTRTSFTQHQKILGYMISRKDEQQWFFAYDFMPPRMTLDYIYCVGYEATARFAELAGRYPEMIESLPSGKYKKRRIKWDEIDRWLPMLSKDLRYMFHRAGLTKDVKVATHENPPAPTEPDPVKTMEVQAIYRGRRYDKKFDVGATYRLVMQRLQIGQPVVVTSPEQMTYATMRDFQKDWKAI